MMEKSHRQKVLTSLWVLPQLNQIIWALVKTKSSKYVTKLRGLTAALDRQQDVIFPLSKKQAVSPSFSSLHG